MHVRKKKESVYPETAVLVFLPAILNITGPKLIFRPRICMGTRIRGVEMIQGGVLTHFVANPVERLP